MKILVIHNKYRFGGGEGRIAAKEINMLRKGGHTVIEYFRDNKEIKKYTLFQKVHFVLNNFYSFKTARDIRKIAALEKPDIAHVHNVWPLITPGIYLVLKKLKIPVVQTIYNYRFLCANGYFFVNNKICLKCAKGNNLHAVFNKCYQNSLIQSLLRASILSLCRFFKIFHKNIDGYIFLSHWLKCLFIKYGFEEPKSFIKPGVIDMPECEPSMNHENYIAYMGRLSSEKGLNLLLQAMKELPYINLKIIGSGEEDENLRAFAEKNNLNNVEFTGHIKGEKRFEILKKAMFSVIPSIWYEPFGLAAVESLALGVPVVGAKTGGLADIIKHKETGLLYELGENNSLKNAIKSLYNDQALLKKMRTAAPEDIKNRFSEDKNYEILIGVYKRLK